jgi:hypothetical protein
LGEIAQPQSLHRRRGRSARYAVADPDAVSALYRHHREPTAGNLYRRMHRCGRRGDRVRLAIPACPPTPAAKAQGPTVVADRVDWRMPPLDELPPAQLAKLNVIWLIVLRAYLFVAAGLVLMRIIMLALGN